jgi:hypothetical protein
MMNVAAFAAFAAACESSNLCAGSCQQVSGGDFQGDRSGRGGHRMFLLG